MASPILKKRNLNGEQVFYLDGLNFTYDNTGFSIVGSETTGPGIYDVNHIIRNNRDHKYKSVPMDRLIPLLLNDNAS